MPRKERIKIGLGSCLQGAHLLRGKREGQRRSVVSDQCGEEEKPKHRWRSCWNGPCLEGDRLSFIDMSGRGCVSCRTLGSFTC